MLKNDNPLVVVNDNQYLEWDLEKILMKFILNESSVIHAITFDSFGNTRYNYAIVDNGNNDIIQDFTINIPNSEYALTEVYFWRNSQDFIYYAHKMISQNKRIRGEFCTTNLIREVLDENKRITFDQIENCIIITEPNDLNIFKQQLHKLN